MNQFEFQNNNLILKVKRGPAILRVFLLLLGAGLFIFPTIGMIGAMAIGKGFHIGFIITIFVSGFLGFHILKFFLWNTFGQEEIEINGDTLTYEANYKWFKDGKKEIKFDNLTFSINSIGYEDEKIGTLVIGEHEAKIESVVKIPLEQLEDLLKILNKQV